MASEQRTSSDDPPGRPAGLKHHVFVSPTRDMPKGGTFSPTTSTIVFGDHDAVLIDAQFIDVDVEALVETVAALGKRLTTIVTTHGHPDHCFGSSRLIERFPQARFVASPDVVAYLAENLERETAAARHLFGNRVVELRNMPEPLHNATIVLEGYEIGVIDVGQADIAPASVVHVPSASLLIAGDLAYNGVHQMLGYSRPAQWADWADNVRGLRGYHARNVIAGHKNAILDDSADRVIDDTARYLDLFGEAFLSSHSAEELCHRMMTAFPDHLNATTLLFSAQVAFKQKQPQEHG